MNLHTNYSYHDFYGHPSTSPVAAFITPNGAKNSETIQVGLILVPLDLDEELCWENAAKVQFPCFNQKKIYLNTLSL